MARNLQPHEVQGHVVFYLKAPICHYMEFKHLSGLFKISTDWTQNSAFFKIKTSEDVKKMFKTTILS